MSYYDFSLHSDVGIELKPLFHEKLGTFIHKWITRIGKDKEVKLTAQNLDHYNVSIGKTIKYFLIFICSFKIIIHMFVFAIISVIWLPSKRTDICYEWLDMWEWTFWFVLICYLDGAAISKKVNPGRLFLHFEKYSKQVFSENQLYLILKFLVIGLTHSNALSM